MEYSVSDLIKILCKKWYMILLVMCLVCGLAVGASQVSYKNAVEEYHRSTEEKTSIAANTGVLEAKCQYRIGSMGTNFLLSYADTILDSALDKSEETLIQEALLAAEPQLMAQLSDECVLQQVQNYADSQEYQEPILLDQDGNPQSSAGPLVVSDHITARSTGRLTFCVTISGLEETIAQELLDSYRESLANVVSSPILDVTTELISNEFTQSQAQYTSAAILAQTIMREPVAAPNMIKTVGTAAVFSFVLACLVILFFTFAKDARKQQEKKE